MATGGWSGLFNNVGGAQHDLLIARGHMHARRISRMVIRRIGGIISAERTFTNLNEDQKKVNHTPLPGQPAAQGGTVAIATVDLTPVPTATFVAQVEKTNAPTYPVDKSGNGGGGKLGTHL